MAARMLCTIPFTYARNERFGLSDNLLLNEVQRIGADAEYEDDHAEPA